MNNNVKEIILIVLFIGLIFHSPKLIKVLIGE
jgi:hypothetical protein